MEIELILNSLRILISVLFLTLMFLAYRKYKSDIRKIKDRRRDINEITKFRIFLYDSTVNKYKSI